MSSRAMHAGEARPSQDLPLRRAGVRVPDQGFAREVCRRAGGALALTSANFSGGTSPLQVRRPALCPLPGQAKA